MICWTAYERARQRLEPLASAGQVKWPVDAFLSIR